MKASEYIAGLQQIIEEVGDLEVIIECPFSCGEYELAGFETQNVVSLNDNDHNEDALYTDEYDEINRDNVITLLKVY